MMYQDFSSVIRVSVPKNKAFRESWLCLGIPTGPDRESCANPEFCTIECALSWYLASWGVSFWVEWEWEFFIKR